jgi:hypothetical protein
MNATDTDGQCGMSEFVGHEAVAADLRIKDPGSFGQASHQEM